MLLLAAVRGNRGIFSLAHKYITFHRHFFIGKACESHTQCDLAVAEQSNTTLALMYGTDAVKQCQLPKALITG